MKFLFFIIIVFTLSVFPQKFSSSDLVGTWLLVKKDPFSIEPPDVENFSWSDSLDLSQPIIIFKEDGNYIYRFAGKEDANEFYFENNELIFHSDGFEGWPVPSNTVYKVLRLDYQYLITLYNEEIFDEYSFYKRIK